MCNKRNSTKIMIIDKWIKVDKCLAGILIWLNYNGLKTVSSCCGHFKKKRSISIVVKGLTEDEKPYFYDLISNKEIPRKRKFYKKDKQGYYYIPEVI